MQTASAQTEIKAAWLQGNWEMHSPKGIVRESWQQVNDTFYKGFSAFLLPSGDTASYEHIKLIRSKNTWWYIPDVSNQNKGKEVRFKLTNATDTSMIFENKAHDFPQQIGYIKTSATSIHAYISGPSKEAGKEKQIDFRYTKKK